MTERKKSLYDKLRPYGLILSIGLLAFGVAAAAFDLALDQVIEAYRRDRKNVRV